MNKVTVNGEGMRVVIYGAGAVGSVLGGHLARVGCEVSLIGRPGQVNAIREHGLRLITPTGTHVLQLPAVTAPDQISFTPDDVVFLCVRSQDTDNAVRELHAVVQDIPVFCFQNGVRNEEIAARYFQKLYGVTVRVGGIYLAAGEVTARTDPPGSPIMGCYPRGTDALVEAVATTLRPAGFSVLVTPDIMSYKWGQLIRNLANAVVAITDVVGDDSERIVMAARKEAGEILDQAGIPWISQEEIARDWPESTIVRGSLHFEERNSTWQSLARQLGTVETDFFNGEIVRLAEKQGTQAPINETVLRIIQEMAAKRELPGKYTPTELCHLIGLD